MARELEYFEEALGEVIGAVRWYAERSASTATAFSIEIDTAEDAIASSPEAWPLFEQGTRRYSLRRFPFSVIYRIERQRIIIVAVAHAHRRPGYWKSRLPG